MKKSIFNQTALKKSANKQPLLFNYSEDNNVFIWNQPGTFVIKCNKLLFESEILSTLPTNQQTELPACIDKTFAAFEDNNNTILTETFLNIDLQNKYTARVYQNYKYKYLTLINTDLLKILNNSVDYTPYQYKENSAVLYKNDFVSCIILPIYNRGMKEKFINLAEELSN